VKRWETVSVAILTPHTKLLMTTVGETSPLVLVTLLAKRWETAPVTPNIANGLGAVSFLSENTNYGGDQKAGNCPSNPPTSALVGKITALEASQPSVHPFSLKLCFFALFECKFFSKNFKKINRSY